MAARRQQGAILDPGDPTCIVHPKVRSREVRVPQRRSELERTVRNRLLPQISSVSRTSSKEALF
jgi:hypothetical protein